MDRKKLLYMCRPSVQVHVACTICHGQKEMSNKQVQKGTQIVCGALKFQDNVPQYQDSRVLT